jgi:hypothetical protein
MFPRAKVLATFAVAAIASVVPVHAQTGVYAQFTGMRPSSGADWMWGPEFGVYQDRHHFAPLHVGIDLRGGVLYGSNGNSMINGLGGIRASIVPHVVPIKVYGEALAGIGVVDVNPTHFTRFQYQVNAGLEYTFFPRLDWRIIEGDYNGYIGNTGTVGNPAGLSTGLVFRLP